MIEFLAMLIYLRRCPNCGHYRWDVNNRRLPWSRHDAPGALMRSCWDCYKCERQHLKDLADLYARRNCAGMPDNY